MPPPSSFSPPRTRGDPGSEFPVGGPRLPRRFVLAIAAAAVVISVAALAIRLTEGTRGSPNGVASVLGEPPGTARTAPGGRDTYPDRSNTGVPAGVTLTASGPLTINDAGTVVDAVDVQGSITINADDVTVRRSRVTASTYFVIAIKEGLRRVRIEDVEVNGLGEQGKAGSTGIEGPATMLRVRVWGVENGIKPYNGSVVQDSMISDLAAPGPDPHVDGIEIDGGADIVVRGNLVDLSGWNQTSAVMIDNYFGPATRIRVEGNRLLGGGYTVYSDGRFKGGPITEVSFRDNRLGKGQWGYASIDESDPAWSGNIDDATGAIIPR